MIGALILAISLLDAGIALPPWPLSPDGERVAVAAETTLQAEGAVARREAERAWTVFPEEGKASVRLQAGDASAVAPVAPSPGRVLLSFEPEAPVKGRDRKVRVLIEVRDAAGGPLGAEVLPVLSASAGSLGPVIAGAEAGRFESTWQPSDGPRPEVLGIVALVPRCPLCATPLAVGTARLPVAAAIELPGRSDPGVLTRVEIAGRVWGPVRADADGRFALPVVVPPGTRWAQASSKSALGNERRSRLDLRLPEAPGLHCAAWPARLPADGRTEAGIFCVGWTAGGGALDLAPLRASAGLGGVGGATLEDGAWRARYRPPRGGAGEDRLSLVWEARGAASRTELPVALAAGAPASIVWRVEGEPVVPGARVRVSATVLDANGDPLGEAKADGRAIEGGWLQARAELGDGVQRVSLRWEAPAGDAPASLALGRVGEEWIAVVRDVAARPVAGVPLRFGNGSTAVTDAKGAARASATGPSETVVGPGGLRAAGWIGVAPPTSPLAIEREGRIALRPAGTFDVEARVEGRWIHWTVRGPDGATRPGRSVRVTSSTVELGPVEREGDGGRCAVRRGQGTVAVEDGESGAVALLEIR